MSRLTHINSSDQFHDIVQKADNLVVVDWFAEWCGPCKQIAPVFEEYSNEYKDVVFLKVDVDANKDLANQYKIRAMPTFHFFKKGTKVDELQGADSNGLGTKIDKHYEKVKSWGKGYSLGASGTTGNKPSSNQNTNSIPSSSNNNDPPAALEPLLNSLIDMGFPLEKSAKALIATNNVGVEDAVNWILTHPDDEVLQLNSNTSNTSVSNDSNDSNKDSSNSDVVDSPKDDNPSQSELSWEEREALMKEKIRKNKEARKKKEEEDEHQRELNRIKNAAQSTQTKRALEEKKRKDAIIAAKKKKRIEREHKQAIKAKIAAAKEERMKKAGQIVVLSQDKPKSKPTSSSNKETKKEYTICSLAIRLPNGETVKEDFKPTDTLRDVSNYLQRRKQLENFAICTNYPRKVYQGNTLDISLKDADLVPRAALTVTFSQ